MSSLQREIQDDSSKAGPPTAGGKAILIATIAAVPLGFAFFFFDVLGKAGDFFRGVRTEPISSESVKVDVVETVSNAHQNLQDIQRILWKLEDEGQALFGRRHTWQISDYVEGETFEALANDSRLTHPDFSDHWGRLAQPAVEEEAYKVLDEYGHIREFYSSTNLFLDRYKGDSKRNIRTLPEPATADRRLEADDLSLEIARALQKAEEQEQRFYQIIKPFFKSQ